MTKRHSCKDGNMKVRHRTNLSRVFRQGQTQRFLSCVMSHWGVPCLPVHMRWLLAAFVARSFEALHRTDTQYPRMASPSASSAGHWQHAGRWQQRSVSDCTLYKANMPRMPSRPPGPLAVVGGPEGGVPAIGRHLKSASRICLQKSWMWRRHVGRGSR